MTLEQLELLERTLVASVAANVAEASESLALIRSEIWTLSKSLRAGDEALVREALEAGRVTKAQPYKAEVKTRLKPAHSTAKSGADLLASLGLSTEIYE